MSITNVPPVLLPTPPPPEQPPHPSLIFAFLWCIAMLLLTQVPGALVSVIILVGAMLVAPEQFPRGGGVPELMKNPVVGMAIGVGLVVAQWAMVLLSLIVLRLSAGRDWPRRIGLSLPGWSHLLLALISLPAVMVLVEGFVHLLENLHLPGMEIFGDTETLKEAMQVFNRWPWPLAVAVIATGPALSEELWCRAFLGRGLVGHYGYIAGAIFTSLLFGFIHLLPIQVLYATVAGLWLHFTYLTTRSLWIPILLHFLNNALSVLQPRVAVFKEMEAAGEAFPPLAYVLAGVLLVIVAWVLLSTRARLVGLWGGPPVWKPAYPGVEAPPPGSGTGVAVPLPGLVQTLAVGLGFVALIGYLTWFLIVRAAGGG